MCKQLCRRKLSIRKTSAELFSFFKWEPKFRDFSCFDPQNGGGVKLQRTHFGVIRKPTCPISVSCSCINISDRFLINQLNIDKKHGSRRGDNSALNK